MRQFLIDLFYCKNDKNIYPIPLGSIPCLSILKANEQVASIAALIYGVNKSIIYRKRKQNSLRTAKETDYKLSHYQAHAMDCKHFTGYLNY